MDIKDLPGDDDSKNGFNRRPYQDQILEICLKKNSIVYLPTGAGKTYIALMAMKYLAKDLEKPLSMGGKRSVFVVNTVALALQQKDCIERATAFKTAVYTGDMNVDFWSRDRWLDEFAEYQVLVATCQIILDVIRHGYLEMKNLNLIIFDEVHHAIKDSPMHQLLSQYASAAESERPRLIGLTGMLVSGKIKPQNVHVQLEKLENAFQGTITTSRSCSDHADVLKYSTNPEEYVLQYEAVMRNNFTKITNIVDELIGKVLDWPMEDQISFKKRIKCLLTNFQYQITDLGIYGGSLASLSILVELELLKRSCETTFTKQIIRQCITSMERVHGLLMDEMDEIETIGDIMSFSSEKVNRFLTFLKMHLRNIKSTDLKALIFVRQRHTAKNLFHILRNCSEIDPNFGIRPDFMVGNNSSMPESIEQILENKWNRKVLEKFKNNEINLIVATSVLEEGIDLQMCNLVVSFDIPIEFRAYVQCKGRARMRGSRYVILCPNDEYTKLQKKLQEWTMIDDNLKNFLIGKTIDRPEPLEEDIKEEFDDSLIPSFRTKKGAVLESQSAIQLLNRYSQSMPNDIFTIEQVLWDSSYTSDGVIVSVTLPMQSTVKDVIQGSPMPSLKIAKRSAAFNACKALYEHGELNEHLLPVDIAKNFEIINDVYFKHYENFPNDKPRVAGTKKNKRNFPIIYPEKLVNCAPVIGKPCYLHIIKVIPKFITAIEDYGGQQFFKLLSCENGFGILTSKDLPNLAAMNFYITLGRIGVEISSPLHIRLTDESSMDKLRNFHCTLFTEVLQINQTFLVNDYRNEENSFFIVPLIGNEIDWKCVNDFQTIPTLKELSEMERQGMKFSEDDYTFKVVCPFYRADYQQRYIVTKIHSDKTPNTTFPNNMHTSYAKYFKEKYSRKVVNSEQFLIEVKGVTKSLNFLIPGGAEGGGKKYTYKGPELLVPELCHNFKFPGDLLLKAIFIPSVLNRLHYLLHAENLRIKIISYLNIPPLSTNYQPKPVIIKMPRRPLPESVIDEGISSKSIVIPDPNQTTARLLPNTEIIPLNDVLKYPWPELYEPINLDRNQADLYPIEIDYYWGFTHKKLTDMNSNKKSGRLSPTQRSVKAICDAAMDEKSIINLLDFDVNAPTFGPEQCDLLASLTSISAGDVFDMERLELMGDSFLKFAVSFFLLQKYPAWHEGFLTSCKGKIVSNRNLCYLGIAAGIPGIININKFDPKSDWAPPLFCLPQEIKDYTKQIDDVISPNIIHKLVLSPDEIKNGMVSPNTLYDYVKSLDYESDNTSYDSPMLQYFGEQRLADKTVADCVESILGACVVSLGIERSLPLLKMFGILPDENARNYQTLLREPFASPRLRSEATNNKINDFLPNCERIEEALGYKFQDRAYLLQALTHPSFQNNRYTQCYQQFEFLGDAILDFLISAYIFERCRDMNPGQLTDLRSALVNNITLACICVRNKFHLHILAQSSVLLEKMKTFAQYQEKENHVVTEQVLLLSDEVDNKLLGDFVDVPKILGDVVEAMIGAVFLDSGNNLHQTWTVIYKLLHKEINSFISNVPIQVVRKLYEFPGANAKFESAICNDDKVMIAVRFTCKNEVLRVEGFGPNSAGAKKAAAKAALHKLTMQ